MLFHAYLIKCSPSLKCSTCSIFLSFAYHTPGYCRLDFFPAPPYFHPTSIPEWRVLIIAIILLVILLLEIFLSLRILVLHDQNYLLKCLIYSTPFEPLYSLTHSYVSSQNPYFQRNLLLSVYASSRFNCWKSSSR